ncbi:MAG TPA: alpha/beta fold hydrolase [Holophagaceae bacterium]|nr:alpha/beta fold hydrolase [Holophagaceae bacterium]
MTPLLIVPGWQDSGPAHWQSLWQAELGGTRIRVASWELPEREDWVRAIETAVAACPAPPVLAGHSVGCIAIAHWAARSARPVKGAFLAAPADVDREGCPEPLRNFAPIPRTPLPFPALVVAAKDDPYAAFDRNEALARAWGARFHAVERGGHLNATSGFGPWPEGRALLQELMR